MSHWIEVADHAPDKSEPVVYRRPNPRRPGCWHVGIAYWTVSQKWQPEMESAHAPQGFTGWMPLAGDDDYCPECIEVGRRAAQHEENHRKANRTIADLLAVLERWIDDDDVATLIELREESAAAIAKAKAEIIYQVTDDKTLHETGM